MKKLNGVFALFWKHRRAIGLIVGSVLSIAGFEHESKVVINLGEQI